MTTKEKLTLAEAMPVKITLTEDSDTLLHYKLFQKDEEYRL